MQFALVLLTECEDCCLLGKWKFVKGLGFLMEKKKNSVIYKPNENNYQVATTDELCY